MRNITSIRSDGNLLPLPIITVEKRSLQKYEIIVVQIMPSKNPPMRYKSCCYVRIGPSTRIASEEEERRLMEKRQTSHLIYDMQGIIDATKADLNMEYFRTQYLKLAVSPEVIEANNRDEEIQMRSLRLLDHKLKPTVTAILLMGKKSKKLVPRSLYSVYPF